MRKALYPGTFDPITNGHLDIIERASKIVDHLIVGVVEQSTKSTLFNVDERISYVIETTKKINNVSVIKYSKANLPSLVASFPDDDINWLKLYFPIWF